MADTGAIYPGLGSTEDFFGMTAWVNPQNIQGNGGSYAHNAIGISVVSDWLRASDFGFAIPSGATIDGVKVEINRKASYANNVKDSQLYLVGASEENGSEDKSSGAYYLTSAATATYGGATSADVYWGLTLTPVVVNDDDFGIRLSAANISAGDPRIAYVYWVQITVYYTLAPPEAECQAASNIGGTTARLNGIITDDKGNDCEARFRYGEVLQKDDFEWGIDEAPLDDSEGGITWTIIEGGSSKAEIDTAQSRGGTRSGRFYRDGANHAGAHFPLTAASHAYAIRVDTRKTDTARTNIISHGNGVKQIYVLHYEDETIRYYDTDFRTTGASLAANTWGCVEVRNIDFTAGTYDIYLDDVLIKDGAAMWASSAWNNQVLSANVLGTSEVWIDNVLVYEDWTVTSWQNSLNTDSTYYEDIASLDILTDYVFQTQPREIVGDNEGLWSTAFYFTAIAEVLSSVALGVAASASRVVGSTRIASVAEGLIASASRVHGRIREAVTTIGTLVSAWWGLSLFASVAVGIATSASRVHGRIRQAAVGIGTLADAIVQLTHPAAISVQRGLLSLEGAVTTAETTLDNPVSVEHSFVIASVRSNDYYTSKSLARVELTTEVSGEWTKIKATRYTGGTGDDCYVEWQVVSGSQLEVQTGEKTFTSTNTSETVTISAVDTAKSFLVLSSSTDSALAYRSFIRGRITSSVEITLDRTASSGTPVVRWYAVQWAGATVEAGVASLTGTTVTPAINEVDLSNTVLFYTYHTSSSAYAARAFTRGRFTSTTELEFARGSDIGTNEIGYFVVSHPSLTAQYPTPPTITGISDTYTLSTAVAESSSFMPTPIMGNAYSDAAVPATLHMGYNTHKLFRDGSNSKVTIERGDGTNNLYPYYFVGTAVAAGILNEVMAFVAVGLVTTASRAIAITRTASSAIGLVITAIGIRGRYRNAAKAVGLTIAATRTLAASRVASTIVGLSLVASYIFEAGGVAAHYIYAAVTIGLNAVATMGWAATRGGSLAIGLIASATRTLGGNRLASKAIGLVISATKSIAISRVASPIVGLVTSASRTIVVSRAASVIIELAISVLVGVERVFRVLTVAGRLRVVETVAGAIRIVKTVAGRFHSVITKEG